MKKNLIFLLIFASFRIFAQQSPAVILDYSIECNVNTEGVLKSTTKKLIQINSPSGRELSDIKIYYDEISKIENITVSILNTNKEVIKRIKNKDFGDYSVLSGYFHTDDRYKEIKAFHNSYPYIIELEYTQVYSEFFSLPSWNPQTDRNLPVIKSSYKLVVPNIYSFHHQFYNFSPTLEATSYNKVFKTYLWKIENINPIVLTAPLIPGTKYFLPYGRFVPDEFIFGQIKGKTTCWKEFGKWNSKLIKGLDELPEEETQKVLNITANTEDAKEKVKILYTYLQEETRYVNISIGIGGWKPFPASYVCETKYGDCKALTNYMHAMLKIVGIKSYYSLIYAGAKEQDIDTNFVSGNFNHAVLCVPLVKDTLWLECTSQIIPFNYWGTATSGKYALVCDYDNSTLVKTPTLKHEENFQNTKAIVKIKDNSLSVSSSREISGEGYEKILYSLKQNNNNQQKTGEEIIPFNHCEISNIEYTENRTTPPYSFTEKSEVLVRNHIKVFGNNMTINPFINHPLINYNIDKNRLSPIFIAHNYSLCDTICYVIPEQYLLTGIPPKHKTTTKFGKIEVSYKINGNQFSIFKQIILNQGLYKNDDIAQFSSFLSNINQIENQIILFQK